MAVHAPITPGKHEDVNAWGWTDEHLSWTWKGLENQPMRVNVYSRSPKVKLFLNGKLIGEKETNKENYTATFEVPYEPGELTAQNSDKKKSSVSLKTAGAPASIRLIPDRTQLKASLEDLSFVKIQIVDKNGNVVPNATVPVRIQLTGNATVAASGNGGYNDMESFRSLTPKTFRGKAIAIIQPTGEKGDIRLTVSSEGLGEASVTLQAE